MKFSACLLSFPILRAVCQSSSSMLASVEPLATGAPFLPPVPPAFQIQALSQAVVGVSTGQTFHLLTEVIYQFWNTKFYLPATDIRIPDTHFGMLLEVSISSRDPEWNTGLTVCWAIGRIIEKELEAMGWSQTIWRLPRTGYQLVGSPGIPIGKSVVRNSRRPKVAEAYANTTSDAMTDPFPSNNTGNRMSFINMTSFQQDRPSILLDYIEDGETLYTRAVLYLITEYLYKVIYPLDPHKSVSDLDSSQREYHSKDIAGVRLRIGMIAEKIGTEIITVRHIAYSLGLLVRQYGERPSWRRTLAKAALVTDPDNFFVAFSVYGQQSSSTIEGINKTLNAGFQLSDAAGFNTTVLITD